MKTHIDTIFDVIDELNESRPDDRQIAKSPETVLFGADGNLDSLGLVNLIVAVEEKIRTETGTHVSLANEQAMSMESSPFRSVETLSGYISELLK